MIAVTGVVTSKMKRLHITDGPLWVRMHQFAEPPESATGLNRSRGRGRASIWAPKDG
jgi:hypothetical protein